MSTPTPPPSPKSKKAAPRPTAAKTAKATVTPPPAPTAQKRQEAEPEPAPEGFKALPNGDLLTVQDIELTFTPRNAKQTSTVLLWTQGQVVTRAHYEKRMEQYAGYNNLEFKSQR